MHRGTFVLVTLVVILAAAFIYVFTQNRCYRDHYAILAEAKREWNDLAW